MRDRMIARWAGEFALTERDLGPNARLRVGPMTFTLRQWQAAGVGNLSVMSGGTLLGLMKMDTVIFTPLERDAPLFSYDRIRVLGNDTMLVELYDTQVDGPACLAGPLAELEGLKEALGDIGAYSPGPRWYDAIRLPQSLAKKGRGAADRLDRAAGQAAGIYSAMLKQAPACGRAEKRARTLEYVQGLLTNGGASTDLFVKKLGQARTEEIFRGILFGVDGGEHLRQ